MALAFDAATLATSTLGDISATHPPVGTPRAVVVLCVTDADTADRLAAANAVQYGGVNLARAQSQTETTGEVARVYAYHLGSGIPTGPQTFSVDSDSVTPVSAAWCITLTGAADTEVAAANGANGDSANPAVTVATGAGFTGWLLHACFSGVSAVGSLTIAGGDAELTNHDFGVAVAGAGHGSRSGADVTANWTAGADDWALTAVAVQEIASTITRSRQTAKTQAVQRASTW